MLVEPKPWREFAGDDGVGDFGGEPFGARLSFRLDHMLPVSLLS
ncbi:hypothetical protein [Terrarubrum flagellatum]